MIGNVQIKICGLTSVADAESATEIGADYLGFIFHSASPRNVSPEQYAAMSRRLPVRRRVAVVVEPTIETLKALAAAGFDRFQVHFQPGGDVGRLARWSDAVGRDRLWLAPKLPLGTAFPEELLPQGRSFLLDGYKPGLDGGTALNSDWTLFGRLRTGHPEKEWILSGGLAAANIAQALGETGATVIDANSGVESAPGVKDSRKLQALADAIRAFQAPR
ncbi:MAG TPA: phosphoribosylanthranilate isomerase [Opitutaceae bacterium]|jgi:phosphoribosylanthranilate isomerase